MASAHELVRALENARVVGKKPFTDHGMFPGPEPAIRIPFDGPVKILIDKQQRNCYITIEDLTKLVKEVVQPV